MKFGKIVLQVKAYQLTELDFRFDIMLSTWGP